LFGVRPLSAFNFQAREQPAFERVCRRLSGSAIDHSSFRHNNEFLVQVIDDGLRFLRRFAAPSSVLLNHSDTAPEFALLLIYFASWKAQTRKSTGRTNIRQSFTASTSRLRNGIICKRYPMARAIKRCGPGL